jgi:hypothetical protein
MKTMNKERLIYLAEMYINENFNYDLFADAVMTELQANTNQQAQENFDKGYVRGCEESEEKQKIIAQERYDEAIKQFIKHYKSHLPEFDWVMRRAKIIFKA